MPESEQSLAKKLVDKLVAGGEISAMIGSAALSEIGAGYAGLSDIGRGAEQGTEAIEAFRSKYTYAPRSETARGWLESAAPYVEKAGKWIDRKATDLETATGGKIAREFTKGAGQFTFEISPIIAGKAIKVAKKGKAIKEQKIQDARVIEKTRKELQRKDIGPALPRETEGLIRDTSPHNWKTTHKENKGIFYRAETKETGKGGGVGFMGHGKYFGDARATAEHFKYLHRTEIDLKTNIMAYKIKPNLKIADIDGEDFNKVIGKLINSSGNPLDKKLAKKIGMIPGMNKDMSAEDLTSWNITRQGQPGIHHPELEKVIKKELKKMGYDGVRSGHETWGTVIFDSKNYTRVRQLDAPSKRLKKTVSSTGDPTWKVSAKLREIEGKEKAIPRVGEGGPLGRKKKSMQRIAERDKAIAEQRQRDFGEVIETGEDIDPRTGSAVYNANTANMIRDDIQGSLYVERGPEIREELGGLVDFDNLRNLYDKQAKDTQKIERPMKRTLRDARKNAARRKRDYLDYMRTVASTKFYRLRNPELATLMAVDEGRLTPSFKIREIEHDQDVVRQRHRDKIEEINQQTRDIDRRRVEKERQKLVDELEKLKEDKNEAWIDVMTIEIIKYMRDPLPQPTPRSPGPAAA